MSMKLNIKKVNQSGFAPLIVSIIIITVLSLVTMSFVLLMNKSRENALNRQLNNDAFYASESGINDAIQAINNGFDIAKTTCGPVMPGSPGFTYLGNNKVNGSKDI